MTTEPFEISDFASGSLSVREHAAARLNNLQQVLKELNTNVPAQVQKCKEFAWSLKLNQHLIEIFNDARWGKICSKNRAEKREGEQYFLQFDLGTETYSFRVRHFYESTEYDEDDERTPVMMTLCDRSGKALFAVYAEKISALKVPFSGYFSKRGSDDIEAFVPGNWIGDILDLALQVYLQRRQEELQRETKNLEEQKKKFGLD